MNTICFDIEDKSEATVVKLQLKEKRVVSGDDASFQNLS